MRGFSKIVITGNLTRDPEMRTTTSGRSVTSFGVAVNRMRKDASNTQNDEVNFYNCSAWGPLGETIHKYAHRGDPILVSGRFSLSTWKDRNGAERSSLEIDVDDFNFLGVNRDGGSSNSSTNSNYQNVASAPAAGQDVAPSDIPDGEVSLDSPLGSAPQGAKKDAKSGDATPSDVPEAEISLDEIPF